MTKGQDIEDRLIDFGVRVVRYVNNYHVVMLVNTLLISFYEVVRHQQPITPRLGVQKVVKILCIS